MKELAIGVLLLAIGAGVLNSLPAESPRDPPAPAVTYETTAGHDDPGITCEQLNAIVREIDQGEPGPCYIHHWSDR